MHRIILDTDPGIDDAMALFLALASPEIQIEAITTVSGNVHVNKTTHNALALLELVGRPDIPVAQGCSLPLIRQPIDASDVHGSDGLGGAELPKPQNMVLGQHAVELIIERVMAVPGEITLVSIGPLTNLALALSCEPHVIQRVREVVIMGGALQVPGNITSVAEFNIYADPHAAHQVFHAGWPIRLISLDVTRSTRLPYEQITMLAHCRNAVTRLIEQMTNYYFNRGSSYRTAGFPMHDPLCIAAVFQPELFTWRSAYVDVELADTLTLGATIAFFDNLNTQVPNMQVSVGVNAQHFVQLFLERIKKFSC